MPLRSAALRAYVLGLRPQTPEIGNQEGVPQADACRTPSTSILAGGNLPDCQELPAADRKATAAAYCLLTVLLFLSIQKPVVAQAKAPAIHLDQLRHILPDCVIVDMYEVIIFRV